MLKLHSHDVVISPLHLNWQSPCLDISGLGCPHWGPFISVEYWNPAVFSNMWRTTFINPWISVFITVMFSFFNTPFWLFLPLSAVFYFLPSSRPSIHPPIQPAARPLVYPFSQSVSHPPCIYLHSFLTACLTQFRMFSTSLITKCTLLWLNLRAAYNVWAKCKHTLVNLFTLISNSKKNK